MRLTPLPVGPLDARNADQEPGNTGSPSWPGAMPVPQAISHEQEKRLLEECSKSRSRSLNPAVTLALSTAMRYSEIRLLKWKQVDFSSKQVWVGKSKTEYGEGRPIPMNDRAFLVMSMWAETFPDHRPDHYVFPTEKYGAAGDDFKPCTYATDPTVPIGDWKEAWEAAKKRAGISCGSTISGTQHVRECSNPARHFLW